MTSFTERQAAVAVAAEAATLVAAEAANCLVLW
jgi:hypothetical protein